MTLDRQGILAVCPGCGTTNRLKFAALDRAAQCGKCRAALSFPAEPIEVPGAAEFDAAVASAPVPILVDFWASWCGPCHMIAPEVAKVAERVAGRALVFKVDTDANPELSQRYQIRSIPTLAVFERGGEARRVAGVQPAATLEQFLLRPHAA